MDQEITLYEINKEALEVLFRELGLAKTLRFLNQFSVGNGDYTILKDQLFKDKSVDDIVNEMTTNGLMEGL